MYISIQTVFYTLYIFMCVYLYIYIYRASTYIQREGGETDRQTDREKERERETERERSSFNEPQLEFPRRFNHVQSPKPLTDTTRRCPQA